MRVHIAEQLDANAERHLRSLVDDRVTLSVAESGPSGPCETLVSGRPAAAWLDEPALQQLIIPWAGLPHNTRPLLQARPHINVHNLHHNAAATAEIALALLLAAVKSLVPLDVQFRRHDWRGRFLTDTTMLLDGKTAVVLGLGAIGTRVAAGCAGLGMRVIAVRRNPERGAAAPVVRVVGIDALADVLPQADALLICAPLTDETRGLIDASMLKRMPTGAVLVNVARGAIVDEAALFAALQTRRLHAAGLDVWWSYPKEANRAHWPPAAQPFHELDNVVMSPHRGGALGSEEGERRRMEALAELLNAAVRGETIPNRVDVSLGY